MKAAEPANHANQIFIPGLVVAESGNTKIAPTEATPPHPFTITVKWRKEEKERKERKERIVVTPDLRLVDGSVAVFRLNGVETVIPLRTHKPYNTAKGRLPADMGGGDYEVSVRTPGGAEFLVGMFKVLAPVLPPTPTEPYITPTHGQFGSTFTITDPQGRMVPGDVVVFYEPGTDPDLGTWAIGVIVDSTTFTGTVPAVTPTQYAVRVRPLNLSDSRFPDLLFLVDP